MTNEDDILEIAADHADLDLVERAFSLSEPEPQPRPAPRRAISAAEIAETLGLPLPTAQQQAVIEAPLRPAIVVAGAGSGKTETMANRVVWLLANGHVRVPEILGLTFTRKAAGELAARIRKRIEQLVASGLTDVKFDPFEAPEVATYNSFANAIFRENALLIGREQESAVLSVSVAPGSAPVGSDLTSLGDAETYVHLAAASGGSASNVKVIDSEVVMGGDDEALAKLTGERVIH